MFTHTCIPIAYYIALNYLSETSDNALYGKSTMNGNLTSNALKDSLELVYNSLLIKHGKNGTKWRSNCPSAAQLPHSSSWLFIVYLKWNCCALHRSINTITFTFVSFAAYGMCDVYAEIFVVCTYLGFCGRAKI